MTGPTRRAPRAILQAPENFQERTATWNEVKAAPA